MSNETMGFEETIDVDDALEAAASDDGNDLVGGSLLQHLDDVFRPLMEYCAGRIDLSLDAAPQLNNDSRLLVSRERLRAEEIAAAERFRGMKAMRPPQPDKYGKIPPRKGVDVVYIGFDAEWEAKSKGRNHVLSVQFHLVGPTGKVFEKVYDTSQVEYTKDRMRLADALYDLLDDAEADGALGACRTIGEKETFFAECSKFKHKFRV